MNIRVGLTIIVVAVVITVMDIIIHGNILMSSYEETAALWRPMEEMKMGLMHLVTLIISAAFVLIYVRFIPDKSTTSAIQYAALFGIAQGISFGYGSYAVMPIPYSMALTWFLGTLAEAIAGGIVIGLMIKGEEA